MNKQEINKHTQPKIKIETILFPEITVSRNPDLDVSPKLDIEMNNEYVYNKEKSILQIYQNIIIKEQENQRELINILGVAIFSITGESLLEDQELSIEHFAEQNAPAIVYPFVREYVSSISSKAGIETIMLPITNFHAIANMKKKENNNSQEE